MRAGMMHVAGVDIFTVGTRFTSSIQSNNRRNYENRRGKDT